MDPFKYRCDVQEVVDGDTLDLHVDMGFEMTRQIRVRLKGIDTAEIYGVSEYSQEHKDGKNHQEYVRTWVEDGVNMANKSAWPFIADTYKDRRGKYGRYIADLRRDDGEWLTDALIEKFPAVESE